MVDMEALGRSLASRNDVLAAWLFGSHARGDAGPLSDIDVAVLLDEAACPDLFRARLTIIGELTGTLGTDDVDVVVLNETPLALNYRVLRDGVLVYRRDQQFVIDFTWRTVTAYLDFKPFLDRYERTLLERAARGELRHGYNPHRGALERHRRLRERLGAAAEADVR
jgi:predicted nucleotidyltransferase